MSLYDFVLFTYFIMCCFVFCTCKLKQFCVIYIFQIVLLFTYVFYIHIVSNSFCVTLLEAQSTNNRRHSNFVLYHSPVTHCIVFNYIFWVFLCVKLLGWNYQYSFFLHMWLFVSFSALFWIVYLRVDNTPTLHTFQNFTFPLFSKNHFCFQLLSETKFPSVWNNHFTCEGCCNG